MLIYAGIDEAGYGPVLGPLCVACAAFRLDRHDPADGQPDLWQMLDKLICRGRKDAGDRIAIDDSKRLKTANNGAAHPLLHLERGVLSFARGLSAADACPACDDDLMALLQSRIPDHPWYAGQNDLPVAEDAGRLRIFSSRLQRHLSDAGVRCLMLCCEVIDAADFNEQVRRVQSKSTVNMAAAMRLVDRIWQRCGDEHPRVIVDRQGGRTHYLGELQTAYPEAVIRILAETEAISRYRISLRGRAMTITFLPKAEDSHFPVALASMTAKYLRELVMLRMNRYFCGEMPELKPTAGYYGDGRRYFREIEPMIARMKVPHDHLLRVV